MDPPFGPIEAELRLPVLSGIRIPVLVIAESFPGGHAGIVKRAFFDDDFANEAAACLHDQEEVVDGPE